MTAQLTVTRLTAEHHREPFGVGERAPRLSWQVETARQGWRQTAYELRVRSADDTTWSSGRVESDESVLVPWPAADLRSRDHRLVSVRVWGDDGERSDWSEELAVEAGLLDPGDWTARFVSTGHVDGPLPLLRKEFDLTGDVVSARLYATALGVYEVELNGAKVGDQLFSPGWTSYYHRLRYQTYDVSTMLTRGPNAIGALLAEGWYRGQLGWNETDGRAQYGDELALLAQLEVTYADGSTTVVGTDGSWRHTEGPLVSSSWYHGEHHDANLELPGWSSPGFDDSGWRPVDVVDHDLATLVAPTGPPVRATGTLSPVTVSTAPSGGYLVDFGQNLVGHLRITVRGERGRVVQVRHAEVLEPDGELCVRPLYKARATDTYVTRGAELEVWEPRFTSHGFRYAEITGWPGELDPADVIAVVCHSDMERTGEFSCSEPLLERLHENVVWSMRGNFVDVPTDCPQRAERLGWTGDAQVFAPTAAYLFQSAGVLSSWLADVAAEQTPEGYVPPFVPFIYIGLDVATPHAFAAWGDAAAVVPWVLYERYGDVGLLRRQYGSMKAWVDAMRSLADDDRVWREGFQFGDWLDPVAPPDQPAAGRTAPDLVATASFARCAMLVSRAAEVLGEPDDRAEYAALAAEVRDAFRAEYVTPSGELTSASQTAYALALEFDLLPEPELRQQAVTRLVDLVRAEGYRIGTGFVGTPLVCDALTAGGELDTAYRLVLQQECPSWLYQVTMGATTIWERWDSLLPDGSVNPGAMTSFNHYAYGAVADWLHRVVGGLSPAAPGYRRLLVRPRPGGGLTHATSSLRTPYGRAEVSWQLTGDELEVHVQVPPGSDAHVVLPGTDPTDVGSGTHTFRARLG